MTFGALYRDLLAADWSVDDIARGYGVTPARVESAIAAAGGGGNAKLHCCQCDQYLLEVEVRTCRRCFCPLRKAA